MSLLHLSEWSTRLTRAINNKQASLNPSLRTAFFLALAIAVVNGFARFAYALILPVMRSDLNWDYALSGWLNTANSLGYGVGGLTGMLLLARYRPSALFVVGLISSVLTLLLVGATNNFPAMLVLRFLTGIGSAWVFSCGGAMVATLYDKDAKQAGSAVAIYYAGGGLGIALSGFVIYPVLSGGMTWSAAWITLGVVGALLAILPVTAALNTPQKQNTLSIDRFPWRSFIPLLAAYLLFGVGYIVYMTFVIAWLKEMQVSVFFSASLWVVVGIGAMASGWVWRRAMSNWWPTRTFALSAIVTAVGSALPLISRSEPVLLLSGLLVGGSFFMTPASIALLSRKMLPQSLWATSMSSFTMIFALGQAIGPVFAGWIADSVGLNTAMLVASLVLLASAWLALLQPRTLSKT
jgi:predicted MFS family arabinose efflux permease